LGEEEEAIAAIAEGNADFEAGRYRPLEEADADFRKKYGIPFKE
jgi:predicted transcriptional regulator